MWARNKNAPAAMRCRGDSGHETGEPRSGHNLNEKTHGYHARSNDSPQDQKLGRSMERGRVECQRPGGAGVKRTTSGPDEQDQLHSVAQGLRQESSGRPRNNAVRISDIVMTSRRLWWNTGTRR